MPYKNKEDRKKHNKIYYSQNRAKLLLQKKEYQARFGVKNRISNYEIEYRKTPKGRFLHTRASKIISFEEYCEMRDRQKNLCAICGNKCQTGKELSIDHCHKQNKVRGLLCSSCNFGLGKFHDDIVLLRKAIKYLKNATTKSISSRS